MHKCKHKMTKSTEARLHNDSCLDVFNCTYIWNLKNTKNLNFHHLKDNHTSSMKFNVFSFIY